MVKFHNQSLSSISEEVIWSFQAVKGVSTLPPLEDRAYSGHVTCTGVDLERGLVHRGRGLALSLLLFVQPAGINSWLGLSQGDKWHRPVCSHSERALAKMGQGGIVVKRVQDILI